MPLDIANHVFEKLEPMDLWVCRNVCQGLRHAVDGFGIHFNTIEFSIQDRSICISLDNETIHYNQLPNEIDTSVTYKNQEKIFEGKNYLEVALKDFGILLNYTSELKISADPKCYTRMHSKLLLKTWKWQKWNHVKKLDFSIVHLDFILDILPHFNSKGLESITMRSIHLDHQFEQITKLDQWKNTKILHLKNEAMKLCPPFKYLFQFTEFDVNAFYFSIQNAVQFRDDLLRRKTFEKCAVRFTSLDARDYSIQYAIVFKPDYHYEDEYEYSNDMGKLAFSSPYYGLFIKRC
ncbi:F-box domain-containing protein [Caenorhabditis elegans]|uniref:F-box domain-containing protein n=1 Tax=Caenorhabditis elegans TaxID=6239 RepID=Q966E3_CAEEL|nr:F-box domain-containing protein [Caenorhabditis elegans]CCD73910.1 F-box domain-containing protein [Caenorhabditis elegans]|eukprot:NP_497376.1 F-box A protein [Caenorhabditis elegans]